MTQENEKRSESMTSSITFVHLSDIHFTGQSGTTIHDLDADVRNELARDASSVLADLSSPAGVLVTGDIAFSGLQAEYERAAEWLETFCSAIGCPQENVWVVPGNHDVDRRVTAASKITRTLQKTLRDASAKDVDAELCEISCDQQSANALLSPLADYNSFAARYQCSLSAEKPFWERDVSLACGTLIRLRGLCSVMVSGADDAKANLVLGVAQVSVPRTTGVEYLTLCHHPPDWLIDQDTVVDHLESKVRVQLFGHKHSQRIKSINETVRLTAGAMHPERGDAWEPMYNIIELGRYDANTIGIRVFQRRWNKGNCQFVAEPDPNSNRDYYEHVWHDCPTPAFSDSDPNSQETSRERTEAVPFNTEPKAASQTVSQVKSIKSTAVPVTNYERRLTYRFLTLPFRHQIAIAQRLDVLTDDDRALAGESLYRILFKRAVTEGKLELLWKKTEEYHKDPGSENPFAGR